MSKRILPFFSALADVMEHVRDLPGVTGVQIDDMLNKHACDIERYEVLSRENIFIAPVVVPEQDNTLETVILARDTLRRVWGNNYGEQRDIWNNLGGHTKVDMIPGDRKFEPGKLRFAVLDCYKVSYWPGGNYDWSLVDYQGVYAQSLAGVEVLFAASQHPEWVRRMDGERILYPVAGGLVLNAPYSQELNYSPAISYDNEHGYLIMSSYYRPNGLNGFVFPLLC